MVPWLLNFIYIICSWTDEIGYLGIMIEFRYF